MKKSIKVGLSVVLCLGMAGCGTVDPVSQATSSPKKGATSSASSVGSNDPDVRACENFFPKDSVGQASAKLDMNLAEAGISLSYNQGSQPPASQMDEIQKWDKKLQAALQTPTISPALYSELNNVAAPFSYAASGGEAISDQIDNDFWNTQLSAVIKQCRTAYGQSNDD